MSEKDDPKRESPVLTESAPASASVPAALATREISYTSAVAAERVAKLKEPRVASLTVALRRARIESAERAAAASDLRNGEIARLEILQDELRPVLSQIPRDCDLFDVGVSPGERPRLFIDQIGFVEMDRDRRAYRFLQDTRHGRITIVETESLDAVVEAITAYIAHRLIERESALAVDYASGEAASAQAARAAARRNAPGDASRRAHANVAPLWLRFLPRFLLVVELLGAAVFLAMLSVLGFWLSRVYAGN